MSVVLQRRADGHLLYASYVEQRREYVHVLKHLHRHRGHLLLCPRTCR
jgi:hypothetical protein